MVSKRVLQIAFALLSLLVTAASAQYTPCTPAEGAVVCTEITTQSGTYGSNGWAYTETAEDSPTPNFPADFTASTGDPAGFYFGAGMPFDPLLKGDTYTATVLACPSGCITSTTHTTVLPRPNTLGAVMGTDSFTFAGATNAAAGYYPYYWSGTFTVNNVCEKVIRRYCTAVGPGPGTLLMSAFNQ